MKKAKFIVFIIFSAIMECVAVMLTSVLVVVAEHGRKNVTQGMIKEAVHQTISNPVGTVNQFIQDKNTLFFAATVGAIGLAFYFSFMVKAKGSYELDTVYGIYGTSRWAYKEEVIRKGETNSRKKKKICKDLLESMGE